MKRNRTSAYTLLEMMIVVTIIGLLAAVAIPTFARTKARARAARTVSDLRVFAAAFVQYHADMKDYPVDANRGVVPAGMENYLRAAQFSAPAVTGGQYDWDPGNFVPGILCVSVRDTSLSAAELVELDRMVDNGDPATGAILIVNGRHIAYPIQ